MSYTATHTPSRFETVQGFWTRFVKGRAGTKTQRDEHGWKARWYWDEKQVRFGMRSTRPMTEDCPHVHRTATGAHDCGQARMKAYRAQTQGVNGWVDGGLFTDKKLAEADAERLGRQYGTPTRVVEVPR